MSRAIVVVALVALMAATSGAAAVPRAYWQQPSVIERGFAGMIHPANGLHFRHVYATCSGVGASYKRGKSLVFQRFFCDYTITYRESRSPDDCSGVVALVAPDGILRQKLISGLCR